MSKSKKKAVAVPLKPDIEQGRDKWDTRWKWLIVAAVIISFGVSLLNDYVLDDFIVIVKNNFTQRGFSGIWDILSRDTFAGMTESNVMVLAGGRYRPLSVVTFAVEHQIFGNTAFISHLVNLAIYAFSGILLYNFLKKILSFGVTGAKNIIQVKAAAITLLFIALPAHSEPVVNIKGRDDLMCLMFFLLASIRLLDYIRSGGKKNFFLSLLFYFLSLMSKETALTFVAVFPLILYFFTSAKTGKIVNITAGYLFPALLFLLFRYLATKDNGGTLSNDVLNNPFVNATMMQKYATIFLSWLYYLGLFFYPLHLSYDYNYNQIPLTGITDWRVLLSIIIHVSLILSAIVLLKKKSIYSFAILFYFVTFSILSNFFFNIGTIFADRFIFIPSLGICMIIVLFYHDFIAGKLSGNLKSVHAVLLTIVLILFSMRNIARCPDWKDNNTLFIADTDDAPNSAKVQLNAGLAYINLSEKADSTMRDSMLHQSMRHLLKGIDIYPTFIDGYMNMGVIYSRLRDLANAEVWWNKARMIDARHPALKEYDRIIRDNYFNIGLQKGIEKKFEESIHFMQVALKYDTLNADILYNIGGAYFTLQKTDSAVYYFQKTLAIKPDYTNAARALQALQMQRRK